MWILVSVIRKDNKTKAGNTVEWLKVGDNQKKQGEAYLSRSHGLRPVCFLNAAEKCEIEE